MSRLCRLKTKTHGDDGKWAHQEITRLRAELASAVKDKESAQESFGTTWSLEQHCQKQIATLHHQRNELLTALKRISTGEADNGSTLSGEECQRIAYDALTSMESKP